MKKTNLIYDPEGQSFIAFNTADFIAVCIKCECGLEIKYEPDSVDEHLINQLSCGVYHFKNYHGDCSNSIHFQWLAEYLMNYFNQDVQSLYKGLTTWKESLHQKYLEYSNDTYPLAIEGINVIDGVQCLFCLEESNKRFFLPTVSENRNIRKHLQSCHLGFNYQDAIKKVTIQQLYSRTTSLYFSVATKKSSLIQDIELLYQSLFPPITLQGQAAALENDSNLTYLSGLESKLHWTERCIKLDMDPDISGCRQELFECDDPVLEDLVENMMFSWNEKVNSCLDFFGINGLKEITISRLTKETSKSYRQEWCKFVIFLIKSSQSEKFSFVKGLADSCKMQISSFYSCLVANENILVGLSDINLY
jgi:hypothetical protein